VLELDRQIAFDSRDAEVLQQVPEKPGVLALFPEEGVRADPFLAKTANLRRRLAQLLSPEQALSKRLRLRDFARTIRFRVTGSAFETSVVLYEQAKCYIPARYRDLLRLRPPAMLKVNLSHEYPRCYVTRRILDAAARSEPLDASFYYGPFVSRVAAQKFADEFLDLFKIRRCQIKIRRDPTFSGCIYSEMKMCLAPCFAGCTKEEYDVEVSRVTRFLGTRGQSLLDELSAERETASNTADFESAAVLHKRIEKLAGILRSRSELERPLGDLNALVVQKAAEEGTVLLYPVSRGRIGEAVSFRVFEQSDRPVSLEQRLRQALPDSATRISNQESDTSFTGRDLSEHLWLLTRWFHSKPREGEILFLERGEVSWRKLANACSRLIKPPMQPS
jgi:excinuclease UvrABC nuclease subunit